MEGVVFSLRDGLELMQSMGLSIERVVASGGGTQHPLWLQLQADILGAEVVRTETQEAAALGAALLAGIGVGLYSDFDAACDAAVRYRREVYRPRPAIACALPRTGRDFPKLYRALAPIFWRPGQANLREA